MRSSRAPGFGELGGRVLLARFARGAGGGRGVELLEGDQERLEELLVFDLPGRVSPLRPARDRAAQAHHDIDPNRLGVAPQADVGGLFTAGFQELIHAASLALRASSKSLIHAVGRPIAATYTTGESYLEAPLLKGEQLESKIKGAIDKWFKSYYRWFEEGIVPLRYPTITRILGSKSSISQASYNDIVDALSCENSFYDRLRFFKGGHETHKRIFVERNDPDRVKRTLTFLLYGRGDPVVRMGRCIFDPEYRLNELGRSAVQELLGWINEEDLPICNNRTLRSLRWFGFDVTLVDG